MHERIMNVGRDSGTRLNFDMKFGEYCSSFSLLIKVMARILQEKR